MISTWVDIFQKDLYIPFITIDETYSFPRVETYTLDNVNGFYGNQTQDWV